MNTILCHGCFDVLHVGHVLHLNEAMRLGGRLVVSITAAQYITKQGRPIFNDEERATMLRHLRCVDEVYVCHEATGALAILKYRPTLYVKGSDYTTVHDWELEACKIVRAEIVFTKTKKYSSTDVLRRLGP